MTLAVISCFGVILTAGYMLWTIQRVFFGPEKPEYKGFPEVDGREVDRADAADGHGHPAGRPADVFFFVFTEQTVDALFGLFRKAARRWRGCNAMTIDDSHRILAAASACPSSPAGSSCGRSSPTCG